MSMNKKKLIVILGALVMAIALAFVFPSNVGRAQEISDINVTQASSVISQKIESLTMSPVEITKVYYKGELIGVIMDSGLIDKVVKEKQDSLSQQGESDYKIGLSRDIYTVQEKSFWNYENKDEEIISYLDEKGLFVVDTTKIEFLRNDAVTQTIFVKSVSDFTEALREFVLMFVDESVFYKLENGEVIPDLTDYGTQDVNVYLEEVIKASSSGAEVSEILDSKEAIFDWLCYGRDKNLTYYTVQEYDTIQGVASNNGLSSKQLISLNDSLQDLNQTLAVGQQLNITYFDSPINVVVESQSYSREITYPELPIYEKDETMNVGEIVVAVEAKNGYNDNLYTEIYVNGVLSGYRKEKTKVVELPVQGVYRVGSHAVTYTGSISFALPCYNAAITCDYYGYGGHTGVDFINPYDRYGEVLAVTNGTIIQNSYNSAAGNFYRIDAGEDSYGNHFVLRYGHMRVPGFFPVGTYVTQGMVIGQIGNTGRSTGPHVHVSVYVNGVQVNPCIYLPCELCRRY